MPCQIDTPTCDDFFDGQVWRGWVGLFQDDNEGQACGCACGIGGAGCHEGSFSAASNGNVVFNDGSRWMRGSRTIVDQGFPVSRDGRGARGHIISVKENAGARRVLGSGWIGDKAPCYYTDGRECYDTKGLCDCSDNPVRCADYPDPDCPPVGGPCLGKRADSFTYTGFDWLNANGQQRCKETTQRNEDVIHLQPKTLFGPMFVRDDFRGHRSQPCGNNRMILCAGINLHGGSGDCGYINPFAEGPEIDDHYIAPHHQMWNFCTIAYNQIGLTDWGTPTPQDSAVRMLKKAALAKIQELPELSQLELYANVLPPNPSANEHLDEWKRSYGVGVPAEQLIPITTVAVLQNCRLRRSGARVRVEYFIREAYVSMSLVPYMVGRNGDSNSPADAKNRIFPHARIRVYLIMGMRASFPDGAPVVGSNPAITLAFEHPDDHLSPPRVVPPIDEIIYSAEIDGQELEFIPPREVDWWGWHDEFGLVPFEGILINPNNEGGGNNSLVACCWAAERLHGLEVHPWPTNADGGGVESIYSGHITLGFVTSNWCGRCGSNHPACNGGGGGAGQIGGARYIPPLGIQPSPITQSPIGRPPSVPESPVARPEPNTPVIRPARPIALNPSQFRPVLDPPIQQPEQPETPPNHKPPHWGPDEQGFSDANYSMFQV